MIIILNSIRIHYAINVISYSKTTVLRSHSMNGINYGHWVFFST